MSTLASNTTPNIGLSQWSANDAVRREDFNSDNALIDAALASLSDFPKFTLGSYVGTGSSGSSHPNILTFDFTPKLVIVAAVVPYYASDMYQGIFIHGTRGNIVKSTQFALCTWGENSLSWYAEGSNDVYTQLNFNGMVYSYIAFGA